MPRASLPKSAVGNSPPCSPVGSTLRCKERLAHYAKRIAGAAHVKWCRLFDDGATRIRILYVKSGCTELRLGLEVRLQIIT
mmetsp:Transcript_12141/g.24377  ORF Transcript_12141/g.24377 Transcript_12141/m.24377 type:complete len:81 (-) Transcript_12141:16-258(-)